MTDPQPPKDTPTSPERPRGDRIAKLLARAGIASRREIERLIAEGRVALDGKVLDTPATILTSLKGVTVDDLPVSAPEAARMFVYHKPVGLLVTEWDPAGRATIYDRLPGDLPRTMPVGRLDLNTEGLLLLTTDGGLKRQLELPATGVERTYRARAYGDVTQAMLEELIHGVEIEGVKYGAIDANLERRTGANVWIELTLTEGKNREVRRVLEHLGLQVGRLIRTRYGPFVLGDLPPGAVGEVKQHDLVAFIKTLTGSRRGKGADLDALVQVEARAAAKPVVETPPAEPRAPRREPEGRLRAPATPDNRAAPEKRATPGGWGSRARPSRPDQPSRPGSDRPQRSARDDVRGDRLPDRTPRDRAGESGERGRGNRGRPDRAEEPGSRPSRGGARPVEGASRTPRGQGSDAERPRTRRDYGDAARGGTADGNAGRARSARSATFARTRDGGSGDRTVRNRDGGGTDRPVRSRDGGSGDRPVRNRDGGSGDRPVRNRDGGGTDRPVRGPSRDADPRTSRGGRPGGAPARPGKGPSGGRGHPPRTPKGKR